MIELFLKWRKLEKGKSEGNKKKMTSRFPLEEKSYFGPWIKTCCHILDGARAPLYLPLSPRLSPVHREHMEVRDNTFLHWARVMNHQHLELGWDPAHFMRLSAAVVMKTKSVIRDLLRHTNLLVRFLDGQTWSQPLSHNLLQQSLNQCIQEAKGFSQTEQHRRSSSAWYCTSVFIIYTIIHLSETFDSVKFFSCQFKSSQTY